MYSDNLIERLIAMAGQRLGYGQSHDEIVLALVENYKCEAFMAHNAVVAARLSKELAK
jgi:hypothetical protein